MPLKAYLALGGVILRAALPVAVVVVVAMSVWLTTDTPLPPRLQTNDQPGLQPYSAWDPSRPPLRVEPEAPADTVTQLPALYPDELARPVDLDSFVSFDRLGWAGNDLFGDWWFFATTGHGGGAWPWSTDVTVGEAGPMPLWLPELYLGGGSHSGTLAARAPDPATAPGEVAYGPLPPGSPWPGDDPGPPTGGVDPTTDPTVPGTIPEPVGLATLVLSALALRGYLARRRRV